MFQLEALAHIINFLRLSDQLNTISFSRWTLRYGISFNLQFFSQQIYFGVCVTICVTASWVGATHCIKYLYLRRPVPSTGYSNNSDTMHRHIVSYGALLKHIKIINVEKYTYLCSLI
jgi:hypothetical protein